MHIAPTWRLRFVASSALLIALSPFAGAQQAAAPRGSTKQMQPADLKAWKNIRQTSLSNDGKWFAYVLAPNEGDATLIIRSTGADAKEMKFPIGEAGGAGGGRGGPGAPAAASSLTISADSRWVAFTVYPPAATGRGGAGRGGRGGAAPTAGAPAPAAPTQNKMALVNLATGEKKEFEKVRGFSFNGDKPTYIAMQSYPEQAAPAAGATPAPGGARGGAAGGGAPAAGRTEGTDLVLYNLTSAEAVNVGNVAEYSFDDSGEWLAYTIDARDQIGNGVQLRNMRT
ncbi:MAG TPA: hypothetical protein VK636_17095, partial [Gemmatimonadaceae bacterium]|nr:hypothetical protein [Gemmatimonadaceae bacterium]